MSVTMRNHLVVCLNEAKIYIVICTEVIQGKPKVFAKKDYNGN